MLTVGRSRAAQASEFAESVCRASNRAVSTLMGGFELVAKRKLVTHNAGGCGISDRPQLEICLEFLN